jgi:hypothetical protein
MPDEYQETDQTDRQREEEATHEDSLMAKEVRVARP